MKEIKSIIETYDATDFSQKQAALVTVVRVEGSSYRRIGARMYVMDDGTWVGGISGGCLEGDALRRARMAIHKRRPTVVTYDTTNDDAHQIGVGLGCNGIIDVLFTPIDPKNDQNPLEILRLYTDTRVSQLLLTITDNQGDTLELGETFTVEKFQNLYPNAFADMENDAQTALSTRKSSVQNYPNTEGGVSVLFEVMSPVIHLVAMGGNYDVLPLARLARDLGWQVSVLANRSKLAMPIYKAAHHVLDKNAEEFPTPDEFTAFVLMAHDYKTDLIHLRRSLTTDVPYIGLLGPKKRSKKLFDELDTEGVTIEENRVFAPVGLEIGAVTPEEIALSIVAEIQSFFAKKSATSLKFKVGAIHE